MIPIGERSLRQEIRDFDSHYHLERDHQGIGNRLIQAQPASTGAGAKIRLGQRLGETLSYYYAAAA